MSLSILFSSACFSLLTASHPAVCSSTDASCSSCRRVTQMRSRWWWCSGLAAPVRCLGRRGRLIRCRSLLLPRDGAVWGQLGGLERSRNSPLPKEMEPHGADGMESSAFAARHCRRRRVRVGPAGVDAIDPWLAVECLQSKMSSGCGYEWTTGGASTPLIWYRLCFALAKDR